MSKESHHVESGPRLGWLARYASKDEKYQWQRITKSGRVFYHRPLGLVESAFDSDGRFFEGRADVNAQLTVEVRSHLNDSELRERLIDCWSSLRLHHPLLRAKALAASDFLPLSHATSPHGEIHFLIEKPQNLTVAREEALESITLLGDHYGVVDAHEFYIHTQNTKRVVDPETFLARLFVLPFEAGSGEPRTRWVRLLMTAAHQITEGLTMINWFSHLLVLLNNPLTNIDLNRLFSPKAIRDHFPLAQETLYPQISGSVARKRWFWVLTLVLRHVKPLVQQGLRNPLRRNNPLPSGSAVPMAQKFSAVLDYSRIPPLNGGYSGNIRLSARATRRLHSVCRRSGASIGAGTFALAALAVMNLDEHRNPNTPLNDRRPFVCSFPLNPRAMFSHPDPPDSLMLAFSEGIVLPYLPSYLPIEGRLRLLARAAHKQLRVYQKRATKTTEESAEKNPARILATNYIMSVERSQMRVPPELRGVSGGWPQGTLTAQSSLGRATHGVSAVGPQRGVMLPGSFPLDSDADFAADFREWGQGMKARDDEFLVGTSADAEGLWLSVSYDGNAMDEEMVEKWKRKVVGLLDFGDDGMKL